MFYKILNVIFKLFVYRGYYRKYKLNKGFKFNGFFIRINGDGSLKVGGNSYVSFYTYINIVKGSKLVIGNNVSIAHNVKIYTSSFEPKTLITEGRKESIIGDIYIGDNVLIGANTFITHGVVIGDNVVVGANSVVTKKLKSNCVYAGSPAKLIKCFD